MSDNAIMSGRGVVPYVTTWSAEQPVPATVVYRGLSGIGFADETICDRDQHGVLWSRVESQQGQGRPLFGEVHSLRQRRAMRKLLCQVCAGTPDQTDKGVLWLLRDHRDDWPGWPNRMGVTEPPVCLPCADKSIRACPALRGSYIAVRAGGHDVGGVYGVLYQGGQRNPSAVCDDIGGVRWSVYKINDELDGVHR